MHEQAMTRLMVLSQEGPREAWEPVTRGLLDALLADARRMSPFWSRVAPAGRPFGEIPPLTKSVIRDRWDDLRCTGTPDERCVPGVTSGSSGEPGRFLVDAESFGAHAAARSALCALSDIPPGVATDFMTTAENPKTDLPPGMTHFSAVDLSARAVARLVERWSGLGRYILEVRSSALSPIVGALEELGGVGPDPGPVAIVASRDTMPPDLRRRASSAFGCPVHLWYGSRETCGYLAGTVAPDSTAYAFNPFLCHVEVVGDDDRPLPPGEVGRILITDLHNRVLPMIRYEMGDLGRMAHQTHGAWPVLEALDGRTSEVMYRADGRPLVLSDLGHRLFGVNDHTRWISGYQFFQDAASGAIEARMVWREPPDAATVAQMLEDMRPAVGDGTPLRIVPVERLETLPSGKRWVVRRA